jgi:beta-glucosidase
VGSDYGATHATLASANADLDQQQPESTFFGDALAAAVNAGQVSEATSTRLSAGSLSRCSASGCSITSRPATSPPRPTCRAHVAFAQQNSEEGTVLLKDTGNVLPLASTTSSIAVIGADGSTRRRPPTAAAPR